MIESLLQLCNLMKAYGATRLYAKKLAANDNSKNQLYLGGGFTSLNIIPNKGVYTDSGKMGSKRDRFKADIAFFWIDELGKYEAPNTQLILYPKYPEVRMSGFLHGSLNAPSYLMGGDVRVADRLLFLGITKKGEVLGYVVGPENILRKEFDTMVELPKIGVFYEMPLSLEVETESKIILLESLRRIHEKEWIASCKLSKDGTSVPYSSSNGGGYTLEAELGITPNGYSKPDYHGWEIKQYNVKNFTKLKPSNAITLMTPEPKAGYYREKGIECFMRRFGYPDKNGKANRLNVGGIYRNGVVVKSTGLKLIIEGYNSNTGKIENVDGGLSLVTKDGEHAATWHFADLMEHWNRKHAKAVYIPSMCIKKPFHKYYYGNIIQLGEGTDFNKLLRAISKGMIYYDPGINLKNIDSLKPKSKKRSQFRIKFDDVGLLYHKYEKIVL